MKKLNSQLILEIVIVLFWTSEYAHVPYFTPYLRFLGTGATMVGMIVAAYGFTQMMLRIPIGIATDVTGAYRFVIISGLFFTTVSSLGLFITTNIVLIFICRVLAGVASSTWIASTVAYMTYYPVSDSVHASARLNALNNGGKLLAFAAGGAAAVGSAILASLLLSECVRDVPDGERSTVVGTFQAVYGLGMTVGPIMMGCLMESFGSTVSCTVFAGATAILAAAVLLFWRRDAV